VPERSLRFTSNDDDGVGDAVGDARERSHGEAFVEPQEGAIEAIGHGVAIRKVRPAGASRVHDVDLCSADRVDGARRRRRELYDAAELVRPVRVEKRGREGILPAHRAGGDLGLRRTSRGSHDRGCPEQVRSSSTITQVSFL
jgi:hypothetical protein